MKQEGCAVKFSCFKMAWLLKWGTLHSKLHKLCVAVQSEGLGTLPDHQEQAQAAKHLRSFTKHRASTFTQTDVVKAPNCVPLPGRIHW